MAHPGIIGLPYIDPAAVYPAPAAGAGAAAGVVEPHDEILDYDYYNTAFFNSGVLHNVFMHLPLGDVMQYATVCSTWATVARDVRLVMVLFTGTNILPPIENARAAHSVLY